MTFEQLRVFIAVAERLHVTQAAAALNMTQSAASAAIQTLEARLGTHLFNRIGRRIELTEAGRAFLPEAKSVLKRLAQAEQTLAELEGLDRGKLSLWASQTIAGYWLPRFIVRFQEHHPRIALSLAIGNTAEVAQAVAAGEADLGFVEGDVEDPLLVRINVGTDQLVLVIGAEHPWAERGEFEASDLTRLQWVLREPGSGTRQIFEDAVRGYGLDPAALDTVLELPSNEAVRSAVIAGSGATVISHSVAAAGLAAGTLRMLPLAFPQRRFTALRHGDRYRSRAEMAFLELVKVAAPMSVDEAMT
jgi:DNA-binding transcriptional LysR family regulator